MSYLVVGSDFLSLYIAKYLADNGSKVVLISSKNFDYKDPDPEIVDIELLKKLKLDYKPALMANINSVELIDSGLRTKMHKTDSNLIDMSYFKRKMVLEMKGKVEMYHNSYFTNQNGENVFIVRDGKGLLLKLKYVLNFEDSKDTNKKSGLTVYKTCCSVIVNRSFADNRLIFLNKGFANIVNLGTNKSYITITADNAESEILNYIKGSDVKILYKDKQRIPLYSTYTLRDGNVIFGGSIIGLTNNLNFDSINLMLEYALVFSEYFHNLMYNKNKISYEELFAKSFNHLKELQSKGDAFWSLKSSERDDMLAYINLSHGMLDFESAFRNLPLMSIYRLKFLFK